MRTVVTSPAPAVAQRMLHPQRGLSLVELMVALVLGLLLTMGLASVYLSSRNAFNRQAQLSNIQQTVRAAFESISFDARGVGHLGCYTGNTAAPTQPGIDGTTLAGNFAIGLTGYEFKNTSASAYAIDSNSPADITDTGKWETNTGGVSTIPATTIGGAGGLTPGSDVLVIRAVSGPPLRLTTATTAASSLLTIEKRSDVTGSCSGSASGLCTDSYALIANCTKARVFQVSALTAAATTVQLTAGGSTDFGAAEYSPGNSEVFPMQTVVYYVKAASSGNGTSLYRRVFDGTDSAGTEQELFQGVENMQVTYGRDTDAMPDGNVNEYVTANSLASTDWSRVVAVRISLLLRAADPVESDVKLPASLKVNDVTVTLPTSGSKYDRRVFTTTIAVRNKIAYF